MGDKAMQFTDVYSYYFHHISKQYIMQRSYVTIFYFLLDGVFARIEIARPLIVIIMLLHIYAKFLLG